MKRVFNGKRYQHSSLFLCLCFLEFKGFFVVDPEHSLHVLLREGEFIETVLEVLREKDEGVGVLILGPDSAVDSLVDLVGVFQPSLCFRTVEVVCFVFVVLG